MQLLTAVNNVLLSLKEQPVTSLTSPNPTLAVIIPEIEMQTNNLNSSGWWYNSFVTLLYPDAASKEINLPDNALTAYPLGLPISVSGKAVIDPYTMRNYWSSPVEVRLVLATPFDKLPETAAQYVCYRAAIECYSKDIGIEQVVQLWQSEAAEAKSRMTAEHLRNMRYSTKQSPRYKRYRTALRG